MLLRSLKGIYTINYDEDKRIVFEESIGHWRREDYEEYHKQFVNLIGPAIGNQPWALVSDLRKYEMSDLDDIMIKHTEWLALNNLQYAAAIVDSTYVKMQINKAIFIKFPQQIFSNEEEAMAWLKLKGF